MTQQYKIERDRNTGEYELVCVPGYGIDGQHFFIEDTMVAIRRVAKDVTTCDCFDCKRWLAEAQS